MNASTRIPLFTLLAFSALLLAGCARFEAVDGVENLWREVPPGVFENGVTTQSEVLDRLGPPSQLISLQDQTVYYYLTEVTSGTGKILIVWNQVSMRSRYDRAIFFFDTDGVLQDFALSEEQGPR